jgi:hypothetical protein
MWAPLAALPLIPLFFVIFKGETGLLVMFGVLLLPGGAGIAGMSIYLLDMRDGPSVVEGDVVEKQVAKSYWLFAHQYVELDTESATRADRMTGARDTSGGRLPEMINVNSGRGAITVTVGGSSVDRMRRSAVREARSEMEKNRFELPVAVLDKVALGNLVRIRYYPRSRITASVERYDSRVQRFLLLT